jgi:hypothetical protein
MRYCGAVRVERWKHLVDVDETTPSSRYTESTAFAQVEADINAAVTSTVWPPDANTFTIYPQSGKKPGEGNGVTPIKLGFVKELARRGWTLEHKASRGRSAEATGKGSQPGAFDCHFDFGSEERPPFVVEWETGNVSSSHRAVNRIALGILRGYVSGGVLVVPSAQLFPYLTDRIGNEPELRPYHELWAFWPFTGSAYFGVVAVEHDAISRSVIRIPKGTDGRALR